MNKELYVLASLINLSKHIISLLLLPFLFYTQTDLHALKNVSTFPLQLATACHVCCYGHTTANIPTTNRIASHSCSTLTIVILLFRIGLLAWLHGGTCLQQPTLKVTQRFSIVSSVTWQPIPTTFCITETLI